MRAGMLPLKSNVVGWEALAAEVLIKVIALQQTRKLVQSVIGIVPEAIL
jgi:hypothetical protein